MKRIVNFIGISFLSFLYATEPTHPFGNHRFYIEPDMSMSSPYLIKYTIHPDNSDIFPTLESPVDQYEFTTKNVAQLFGINIGYEFLKPNNLYAAVSAQGSVGNLEVTVLYDELGLPSKFDIDTLSAELKGNVGYTFKSGVLSVSPYSGLGWYEYGQKIQFKTDDLYVPIGIKTEYLSPDYLISIGLKFELQQNFKNFAKKNDNDSLNPDSFWDKLDYEISAPICLYGEHQGKNWYGSVEPYLIIQANDFNLFGGKFAANRQF